MKNSKVIRNKDTADEYRRNPKTENISSFLIRSSITVCSYGQIRSTAFQESTGFPRTIQKPFQRKEIVELLRLLQCGHLP